MERDLFDTFGGIKARVLLVFVSMVAIVTNELVAVFAKDQNINE